MFITADSPWGCGKARRCGLEFQCLMPAPTAFLRVKGIFTGALKLACIILKKNNGKSRTKTIVCGGFPFPHLGIFSAALLKNKLQ